jgi:hypothetical protein
MTALDPRAPRFHDPEAFAAKIAAKWPQSLRQTKPFPKIRHLRPNSMIPKPFRRPRRKLFVITARIDPDSAAGPTFAGAIQRRDPLRRASVTPWTSSNAVVTPVPRQRVNLIIAR